MFLSEFKQTHKLDFYILKFIISHNLPQSLNKNIQIDIIKICHNTFLKSFFFRKKKKKLLIYLYLSKVERPNK